MTRWCRHGYSHSAAKDKHGEVVGNNSKAIHTRDHPLNHSLWWLVLWRVISLCTASPQALQPLWQALSAGNIASLPGYLYLSSALLKGASIGGYMKGIHKQFCSRGSPISPGHIKAWIASWRLNVNYSKYRIGNTIIGQSGLLIYPFASLSVFIRLERILRKRSASSLIRATFICRNLLSAKEIIKELILFFSSKCFLLPGFYLGH